MPKLLREYLTLGSLATVAAVVGIGSGVYSMTRDSGGGNNGGAPGPTGSDVGTADDAWQQLLRQMMTGATSEAGTLQPYLSGAFADSSGQYAQLANLMRSFGGRLGTEADTMFKGGDELRTAGRQLWDTARDPQNAMRDRLLQQTQDQSRAATSMRGIGMSPQAAGIENQAVTDFGLNWNDRQLGRQAQGLSGYSNAFNEAGRQSQAGGADLAGATSMFQGAGKLPFDLANFFSSAMNSGIYGPAAGIMGQIDPYIGLGQSGQQNAFNQNQQNLGNLATGLNSFGSSPGMGWLTSFFGGSPGGGSNASGYTSTGGYGDTY